jgi:glycosyl transferase, family 25
MDIPVFVINLKRSVERREYTTRQLNDLGMTFQLIEAIDGVELSDQEIRNNPDFGIYKSGYHSSYLRKEEIGCVLSHLKIFRKMVDEKIEQACILEDDNDYSMNFKDLLIGGNLNTTEWDILYLGHHSACTTKEAQSTNKKQLVSSDSKIGEAIEVPYGAYAYIINIDAAKKILNLAFPIRMPFDSYIGNGPAIGLRTSLVTPPCVLNKSVFNSTIYSGINIIYSERIWEVTDILIRKLYLWLPILRKIRVWIYIKWHSLFLYLRKTGLLKNNYARF